MGTVCSVKHFCNIVINAKKKPDCVNIRLIVTCIPNSDKKKIIGKSCYNIDKFLPLFDNCINKSIISCVKYWAERDALENNLCYNSNIFYADCNQNLACNNLSYCTTAIKL